MILEPFTTRPQCLQCLQCLQMPTHAYRRIHEMRGSASDFSRGGLYGIGGTIPFQNPVHDDALKTFVSLRVPTGVSSPSSTPFPLARTRREHFSLERGHRMIRITFGEGLGGTSSNSAITHDHGYAISFAQKWALRPAPEGGFPSQCWGHSACSWKEYSPPDRRGHTRLLS